MQKKEDGQQNNCISFFTCKAHSRATAQLIKTSLKGQAAEAVGLQWHQQPEPRSFIFAGTTEDNSRSVALRLCHSSHLEQQLTCHLSPLTALLVLRKTKRKSKSKTLLAGAKAISWSPWLMWQITSQSDTRINEERHVDGTSFGSRLGANSD